jgi:hypothetical protein
LADPAEIGARIRAAGRYVGKFDADVTAGTRKSKRSAACAALCYCGKALERLITISAKQDLYRT